MKTKLFVIILVSCCFIFIGCENNSISSPSNTLLLKDLPQTEQASLGSNNIQDRYPCANDDYAERTFASYTNFSWDSCETFNEITIEAYEAARLWAEYNPSWDEDLDAKACGSSIPSNQPDMDGFVKLSGRWPTMQWDFMWAHYWIIERKIGSGSYSTVYTYTLPLEPMSSAPDTNWVDTSIYLRTFENIVYYRIKGRIWNEYSSSAPVIYWDNRPYIENMDL